MKKIRLSENITMILYIEFPDYFENMSCATLTTHSNKRKIFLIYFTFCFNSYKRYSDFIKYGILKI